MNDIRLEGVTKEYTDQEQPVTALDGFSATIRDGEFHVLIGPSGSGKTTLLRVLAGLEEVTTGDLDVPEATTGYLFQEYGLFYWRTVRENLELMAELAGHEVDDADIRSLLERVGLEDAADSLPHTLSGGMRQRAALARTLIYEPELLLMDEPFGALDELTRRRLYDEFDTVLEQGEHTVVYVTHDLEEAYRFGDRVTVLSQGRDQETLDPSRMERGVFDRQAVEAMGR